MHTHKHPPSTHTHIRLHTHTKVESITFLTEYIHGSYSKSPDNPAIGHVEGKVYATGFPKSRTPVELPLISPPPFRPPIRSALRSNRQFHRIDSQHTPCHLLSADGVGPAPSFDTSCDLSLARRAVFNMTLLTTVRVRAMCALLELDTMCQDLFMGTNN
jgi:hypothetical protein